MQAIGRLGWAYASTKERPAPPKTAPLARAAAAGGRPAAEGFARGRARRRSAGAAASRRAGRGGHQPRRRRRVSVPRGLRRRHRRQGPAAAHSRPTTRRADRTEPIEPPPTPDPAFSLPSLLPIPRPPYPRLPPRRTRWSTHRSQIRHQPTHHPRPAPLPPPRPRPTSTRLGKPAPHLPGRSRKGGPARSGGPPFLQSPGGKPRKHPGAGRRPVALRAETHRAKQIGGKHKEGNRCRVRFSSALFPGEAFDAARPLHQR